MTGIPIACIVEGQGDVISIPIILRRLAEEKQTYDLKVLKPIRVHRSKVVRPGELERAVELAARKLFGAGGIVVVLDADDDLPCVLGPDLLSRARECRSDLPLVVVLPNREKEAWFLASVESLRGRRGLAPDVTPPPSPEGVRGAKTWLGRRMGKKCSEVADQPAFASFFDLAAAREGCPSFAKLCRDFWRMLDSLSPDGA